MRTFPSREDAVTRKLLAIALSVLLIGPGCANNPHGHSGKLIAEHTPGDCPEQTVTPYKAVYVLFRWNNPPDGPPPRDWIPEKEVVELYTRGLARWQSIGFQKDKDGKLVAVAGEEKIPLEDGRYCWHISPDTEYHGAARLAHEAGENVLFVVTMPVAVVGFVCMLPIFLVAVCLH
jgi:hypothetical protein